MEFMFGLLTGIFAIVVALAIFVVHVLKVKLDLPAPKTNGHLKQNGSIITNNSEASREVTPTSTNSPDFTDISETRLRLMIQKIIAETINMPPLLEKHAVSEISLDGRSKTTDNMSLTNGHRYRTEHYFEPKIYQDLLATAVLNKIVDKQLNNLGMLESSSNLSRGDGGGDGGGGGGGGDGSTDNHAILDQNFNIENQSITSGSSVEPHSDCSYTDMEQILNANDDKTSDLIISAGRESVMSDYLASHMVPLPDLSTMATESEEDDYMSVTSSAFGDGTWENNWLFKKKKPTLGGTVAASSVGMLVPDPKEDVRAQIGDKTADEVSDLSELGSDTDDSLEILRTKIDPINDRLINKHLIGGQNNKLVLDELIERSSMISNTLPSELEQAYTETRNEHVIEASAKTEAVNADVNQQNNNNSKEEVETEVILPPAGFEDSNPLAAGDDFTESDGCTGFSTVEILEPDVHTPSVVEILAAMALGPMLAVPAVDQSTALTVSEFKALSELKDLALEEIKARSLELTPHSLSVIPEEPGEHLIDLKNVPTPDELSEEIINDFERGLITAVDFSNLESTADVNDCHIFLSPAESVQKAMPCPESLNPENEILEATIKAIDETVQNVSEFSATQYTLENVQDTSEISEPIEKRIKCSETIFKGAEDITPLVTKAIISNLEDFETKQFLPSQIELSKEKITTSILAVTSDGTQSENNLLKDAAQPLQNIDENVLETKTQPLIETTAELMSCKRDQKVICVDEDKSANVIATTLEYTEQPLQQCNLTLATDELIIDSVIASETTLEVSQTISETINDSIPKVLSSAENVSMVDTAADFISMLTDSKFIETQAISKHYAPLESECGKQPTENSLTDYVDDKVPECLKPLECLEPATQSNTALTGNKSSQTLVLKTTEQHNDESAVDIMNKNSDTQLSDEPISALAENKSSQTSKVLESNIEDVKEAIYEQLEISELQDDKIIDIALSFNESEDKVSESYVQFSTEEKISEKVNLEGQKSIELQMNKSNSEQGDEQISKTASLECLQSNITPAAEPSLALLEDNISENAPIESLLCKTPLAELEMNVTAQDSEAATQTAEESILILKDNKLCKKEDAILESTAQHSQESDSILRDDSIAACKLPADLKCLNSNSKTKPTQMDDKIDEITLSTTQGNIESTPIPKDEYTLISSCLNSDIALSEKSSAALTEDEIYETATSEDSECDMPCLDDFIHSPKESIPLAITEDKYIKTSTTECLKFETQHLTNVIKEETISELDTSEGSEYIKKIKDKNSTILMEDKNFEIVQRKQKCLDSCTRSAIHETTDFICSQLESYEKSKTEYTDVEKTTLIEDDIYETATSDCEESDTHYTDYSTPALAIVDNKIFERNEKYSDAVKNNEISETIKLECLKSDEKTSLTVNKITATAFTAESLEIPSLACSESDTKSSEEDNVAVSQNTTQLNEQIITVQTNDEISQNVQSKHLEPFAHTSEILSQTIQEHISIPLDDKICKTLPEQPTVLTTEDTESQPSNESVLVTQNEESPTTEEKNSITVTEHYNLFPTENNIFEVSPINSEKQLFEESSECLKLNTQLNLESTPSRTINEIPDKVPLKSSKSNEEFDEIESSGQSKSVIQTLEESTTELKPKITETTTSECSTSELQITGENTSETTKNIDAIKPISKHTDQSTPVSTEAKTGELECMPVIDPTVISIPIENAISATKPNEEFIIVDQNIQISATQPSEHLTETEAEPIVKLISVTKPLIEKKCFETASSESKGSLIDFVEESSATVTEIVISIAQPAEKCIPADTDIIISETVPFECLASVTEPAENATYLLTENKSIKQPFAVPEDEKINETTTSDYTSVTELVDLSASTVTENEITKNQPIDETDNTNSECLISVTESTEQPTVTSTGIASPETTPSTESGQFIPVPMAENVSETLSSSECKTTVIIPSRESDATVQETPISEVYYSDESSKTISLECFTSITVNTIPDSTLADSESNIQTIDQFSPVSTDEKSFENTPEKNTTAPVTENSLSETQPTTTISISVDTVDNAHSECLTSATQPIVESTAYTVSKASSANFECICSAERQSISVPTVENVSQAYCSECTTSVIDQSNSYNAAVTESATTETQSIELSILEETEKIISEHTVEHNANANSETSTTFSINVEENGVTGIQHSEKFNSEENLEILTCTDSESITQPAKQSILLQTNEKISEAASLECTPFTDPSVSTLTINKVSETKPLTDSKSNTQHAELCIHILEDKTASETAECTLSENTLLKESESIIQPTEQSILELTDENISETVSLNCTASALKPIEISTVKVADNTILEKHHISEYISEDAYNNISETTKLPENAISENTPSPDLKSITQLMEQSIIVPTQENISGTASLEHTPYVNESIKISDVTLADNTFLEAQSTEIVDTSVTAKSEIALSSDSLSITQNVDQFITVPKEEKNSEPVEERTVRQNYISEIHSTVESTSNSDLSETAQSVKKHHAELSTILTENTISESTSLTDSEIITKSTDQYVPVLKYDEMSEITPLQCTTYVRVPVDLSFATASENATSESQSTKEPISVDPANEIPESVTKEFLAETINQLSEQSISMITSYEISETEPLKFTTSVTEAVQITSVTELINDECEDPDKKCPEIVNILNILGSERATSESLSISKTQPTNELISAGSTNEISKISPSTSISSLTNPVEKPTVTLTDYQIAESSLSTESQYITQTTVQNISEQKQNTMSETTHLEGTTSAIEPEEVSILTATENYISEIHPDNESISVDSDKNICGTEYLECLGTDSVKKQTAISTENTITESAPSTDSEVFFQSTEKYISLYISASENVTSETQPILETLPTKDPENLNNQIYENIPAKILSSITEPGEEPTDTITKSAEKSLSVLTDEEISQTGSLECTTPVKDTVQTHSVKALKNVTTEPSGTKSNSVDPNNEISEIVPIECLPSITVPEKKQPPILTKKTNSESDPLQDSEIISQLTEQSISVLTDEECTILVQDPVEMPASDNAYSETQPISEMQPIKELISINSENNISVTTQLQFKSSVTKPGEEPTATLENVISEPSATKSISNYPDNAISEIVTVECLPSITEPAKEQPPILTEKTNTESGPLKESETIFQPTKQSILVITDEKVLQNALECTTSDQEPIYTTASETATLETQSISEMQPIKEFICVNSENYISETMPLEFESSVAKPAEESIATLTDKTTSETVSLTDSETITKPYEDSLSVPINEAIFRNAPLEYTTPVIEAAETHSEMALENVTTETSDTKSNAVDPYSLGTNSEIVSKECLPSITEPVEEQLSTLIKHANSESVPSESILQLTEQSISVLTDEQISTTASVECTPSVQDPVDIPASDNASSETQPISEIQPTKKCISAKSENNISVTTPLQFESSVTKPAEESTATLENVISEPTATKYISAYPDNASCEILNVECLPSITEQVEEQPPILTQKPNTESGPLEESETIFQPTEQSNLMLTDEKLLKTACTTSDQEPIYTTASDNAEIKPSKDFIIVNSENKISETTPLESTSSVTKPAEESTATLTDKTTSETVLLTDSETITKPSEDSLSVPKDEEIFKNEPLVHTTPVIEAAQTHSETALENVISEPSATKSISVSPENAISKIVTMECLPSITEPVEEQPTILTEKSNTDSEPLADSESIFQLTEQSILVLTDENIPTTASLEYTSLQEPVDIPELDNASSETQPTNECISVKSENNISETTPLECGSPVIKTEEEPTATYNKTSETVPLKDSETITQPTEKSLPVPIDEAIFQNAPLEYTTPVNEAAHTHSETTLEHVISEPSATKSISVSPEVVTMECLPSITKPAKEQPPILTEKTNTESGPLEESETIFQPTEQYNLMLTDEKLPKTACTTSDQEPIYTTASDNAEMKPAKEFISVSSENKISETTPLESKSFVTKPAEESTATLTDITTSQTVLLTDSETITKPYEDSLSVAKDEEIFKNEPLVPLVENVISEPSATKSISVYSDNASFEIATMECLPSITEPVEEQPSILTENPGTDSEPLKHSESILQLTEQSILVLTDENIPTTASLEYTTSLQEPVDIPESDNAFLETQPTNENNISETTPLECGSSVIKTEEEPTVTTTSTTVPLKDSETITQPTEKSLPVPIGEAMFQNEPLEYTTPVNEAAQTHSETTLEHVISEPSASKSISVSLENAISEVVTMECLPSITKPVEEQPPILTEKSNTESVPLQDSESILQLTEQSISVLTDEKISTTASLEYTPSAQDPVDIPASDNAASETQQISEIQPTKKCISANSESNISVTTPLQFESSVTKPAEESTATLENVISEPSATKSISACPDTAIYEIVTVKGLPSITEQVAEQPPILTQKPNTESGPLEESETAFQPTDQSILVLTDEKVLKTALECTTSDQEQIYTAASDNAEMQHSKEFISVNSENNISETTLLESESSVTKPAEESTATLTDKTTSETVLLTDSETITKPSEDSLSVPIDEEIFQNAPLEYTTSLIEAAGTHSEMALENDISERSATRSIFVYSDNAISEIVTMECLPSITEPVEEQPSILTENPSTDSEPLEDSESILKLTEQSILVTTDEKIPTTASLEYTTSLQEPVDIPESDNASSETQPTNECISVSSENNISETTPLECGSSVIKTEEEPTATYNTTSETVPLKDYEAIIQPTEKSLPVPIDEAIFQNAPLEYTTPVIEAAQTHSETALENVISEPSATKYISVSPENAISEIVTMECLPSITEPAEEQPTILTEKSNTESEPLQYSESILQLIEESILVPTGEKSSTTASLEYTTLEPVYISESDNASSETQPISEIQPDNECFSVNSENNISETTPLEIQSSVIKHAEEQTATDKTTSETAPLTDSETITQQTEKSLPVHTDEKIFQNAPLEYTSPVIEAAQTHSETALENVISEPCAPKSISIYPDNAISEIVTMVCLPSETEPGEEQPPILTEKSNTESEPLQDSSETQRISEIQPTNECTSLNSENNISETTLLEFGSSVIKPAEKVEEQPPILTEKPNAESEPLGKSETICQPTKQSALVLTDEKVPKTALEFTRSEQEPLYATASDNATLELQPISEMQPTKEFISVNSENNNSESTPLEFVSSIAKPAEEPTDTLTENTISGNKHLTESETITQSSEQSISVFTGEEISETGSLECTKPITGTVQILSVTALESATSETKSTDIISVEPDDKISDLVPTEFSPSTTEPVEEQTSILTENAISKPIKMLTDNKISLLETVESTVSVTEPSVKQTTYLGLESSSPTDLESTRQLTEQTSEEPTDETNFETVREDSSTTDASNSTVTEKVIPETHSSEDKKILETESLECPTSTGPEVDSIASFTEDKVPEVEILKNLESITQPMGQSLPLPTNEIASETALLECSTSINVPIEVSSVAATENIILESQPVQEYISVPAGNDIFEEPTAIKDNNIPDYKVSEALVSTDSVPILKLASDKIREFSADKSGVANMQNTEAEIVIKSIPILTDDKTAPSENTVVPLKDSESTTYDQISQFLSSECPTSVNESLEKTTILKTTHSVNIIDVCTPEEVSPQEHVQSEVCLVINTELPTEEPEVSLVIEPEIPADVSEMNLRDSTLESSSPVNPSEILAAVTLSTKSKVSRELNVSIAKQELTTELPPEVVSDFNTEIETDIAIQSKSSEDSKVLVVSQPPELDLASEGDISEVSVEALTNSSIAIAVPTTSAQLITKPMAKTFAQDASLTPSVIIQPETKIQSTDLCPDTESLAFIPTNISTDEQVSFDETIESPSITRQLTVVEIEPHTAPVDDNIKETATQATDSVTTAQSLGNSNVFRKLQRQYRVEDTTPSFEDVGQLTHTQPPNTSTNSLANLCQKYIQDKHLITALEKRRRQTLLMHRFLSTLDSYNSNTDDGDSVEEETIDCDTEVQTQIIDRPPPTPVVNYHDHDSDDVDDNDCSDSFNFKVNEQNTMISYNFINNILFSDQLSYDSNHIDDDSRTNTVEEYIENDTNDEKDILVDKFNNITTTHPTNTTATTNTYKLTPTTTTSNDKHRLTSNNGTSSLAKATKHKRFKRQSNKNSLIPLTSAVQNQFFTPPLFKRGTREHVYNLQCLSTSSTDSNDDVNDVVDEVELLIEDKDEDDDNDEVAMLRHFVPGSIAEREYKKWNNAVEMPNNPYAPEALKRRISGSQERFIDLPNISPIKEQNPLELLDKDKLDVDETDKRESDYRRYSRDYYINNSSHSSQTSTPRETPATPTKDNLENTKATISPTVKETDIGVYKAIPAQVVEDTTSSIDTISQQSIQSGNTTTSDDSDTIKIYDFKKQETTVLRESKTPFEKEAVKDVQPKERPTVLNLSRSESAGNVTTPTRGSTPTAFKFLQPKRKIFDPSQVLSLDEDAAPEVKSPLEKPVIEQEVAEALPSVKALAKAFLMTTKSSQSENRWLRKARTLSQGEKVKIPTPVRSLDPTPSEIVKVDEDVTITSDLSSLETDSSLVYREVENTKDIPETTLSPTADCTTPITSTSGNNSPALVRQGGLKNNIAFFENLKFK